VKIGLVGLLLAVVAAGGGYFSGLAAGSSSSNAKSYDARLLSLASLITIRDGLVAGDLDSALEVLDSKLQNEFFEMLDLRGSSTSAASEAVRCSVSRRVRKFRSDRVLFNDDKEMKSSGFAVDDLVAYLSTECPGNPSHANWVSPPVVPANQ
jgi:hypothetical protein